MADWGYPEHKDVVILGKHNFDAFLKDFEMALVAFSSQWCDHCKELDSELTKLAIYFKDHEERIPVAKVDCTKQPEFCSDHMVPVFPFLNFYVRGHPIPYLGRHQTEVRLRSHIHSILANSPNRLDSLAQLNTGKQFSSKLGSKPRTRRSVYYLPPPLKPTSNEDHHSSRGLDTSEILKPFHLYDLSCKLNTWLECYWTNNLTLFESAGGREDHPLILISRKKKVTSFPYHPNTLEDLTDYLFHFRYPGLREADGRFERDIIKKSRDFLTVFVPQRTDSAVESFRQACRYLRLRGNCILASLDSEHPEIVSKLAKALDTDMKSLPAVVYAQSVHDYTLKRYKFRGDLTNSALEAFLTEVWNGERNSDLKSGPIPLKNEGPIKVSKMVSFSDTGGVAVHTTGQQLR